MNEWVGRWMGRCVQSDPVVWTTRGGGVWADGRGMRVVVWVEAQCSCLEAGGRGERRSSYSASAAREERAEKGVAWVDLM